MFTKENIKLLLKNENISKCSERSITFNKDFKIKAIKLYEEGMPPKEIFRQAKIDLGLVGKHEPKECLRRWNKIVKKRGIEGLSEHRKGGGRKPKIIDKTDADKIKRLEAEVAYLKAENDFLTKLRAKRAESNSSLKKNTGSLKN